MVLYSAWAHARLHADGPLVANTELVATFVTVQVLCCAAVGTAWSWVEQRLRNPSLDRRGFPSTVRIAFGTGLHLFTLMAALAVALQLCGLPSPIGEPMAWCALLALAAAALASLYVGAGAGIVSYVLFACGLLAILLTIQSLPLTRHNGWYVPLLVTGYLVATTGVVRLYERFPIAQRWLPRPASTPDGWDWFFSEQALLASTAVLLSLGMTCWFPTLTGRLSGPVACAMAACVWWLLVDVWARVIAPDLSPYSPFNLLRLRACPRYVTLALAVLALVELACAGFDPTNARRWLQRTAAVLPVLAAVAAVLQLVAPRLPTRHAWREPFRDCAAGAMLTGYAAGFLLLVLLLAGIEPAARAGEPLLSGWLVMLAALALLTLAGLSLRYALNPNTDALGLPAAGAGCTSTQRRRCWRCWCCTCALPCRICCRRCSVDTGRSP